MSPFAHSMLRILRSLVIVLRTKFKLRMTLRPYRIWLLPRNLCAKYSDLKDTLSPHERIERTLSVFQLRGTSYNILIVPYLSYFWAAFVIIVWKLTHMLCLCLTHNLHLHNSYVSSELKLT